VHPLASLQCFCLDGILQKFEALALSWPLHRQDARLIGLRALEKGNACPEKHAKHPLDRKNIRLRINQNRGDSQNLGIML
jgi:hypothetical protein